MTDEDRRDAEGLITERLKQYFQAGSGFTSEQERLISLFYLEGYAAACEAKRNSMSDNLQVGVITSDLLFKLNSERARSAKLIEAINDAMQSWGIDVIFDEIGEAIAEYEASRG